MPRGATLLELLVTMSLLAIVAAGVFSLYSIGVFANQHAGDLAVAAEMAQAHLEHLIANPYDPAATRGTGDGPADPPGYRWTAEIITLASGLEQGTVVVAWERGGRHYHVTLTTLLRVAETP